MNEELKKKALDLLMNYNGPKVRIMEVCGTHTHEIFRLGIRKMLSPQITLISGPGCPVCVTPVSYIDEAIMLAMEHKATICTFGDLVRVPGSEKSLSEARGEGAKIKVVYTPGDAVDYAKEHPEENVVFLSVGFETTTPVNCLAVVKAKELGIKNFFLLTSNKTMPQAYTMLRDSVDVYLYPGHVNAIVGTGHCEHLAKDEGISGVVAGFTADELILALALAVKNFEKGEAFFVNAYPRVVAQDGSVQAQKLVEEMMEPCDCIWRGLGVIPMSGMKLRREYEAYDARVHFALPEMEGREHPACRCGEILQGKISPEDCPCFGKGCTPMHPIGACMVSNEGMCSAYFQYGGL